MSKGKVKAWLKEKGKDTLGNVLDFVGENTAIPVLSNLMEGIGEKLQDDPEISEEDFAQFKEIRDAELESYKVTLADRDSARNREIEIAKTKRTDWMMYLTGLIALLSFAFMIYAVIYVPNLSENKLAIHLLGMVEGFAGSIFFYYFGSSKGSKDKTDLLGKR